MFVIGTSDENKYLLVRKSKKFWAKMFLICWRVNNHFYQKFQLQTSFRITRSTKKIMMSTEYCNFSKGKSIFAMESRNWRISSNSFCGSGLKVILQPYLLLFCFQASSFAFKYHLSSVFVREERRGRMTKQMAEYIFVITSIFTQWRL